MVGERSSGTLGDVEIGGDGGHCEDDATTPGFPVLSMRANVIKEDFKNTTQNKDFEQLHLKTVTLKVKLLNKILKTKIIKDIQVTATL